MYTGGAGKTPLVIFGGEALELQSLRPWFERHGDQRPQLVNMYGITETTVHVTYHRVTAQDLVMDLGSGDGITVITAAKRGAKAIGKRARR